MPRRRRQGLISYDRDKRRSEGQFAGGAREESEGRKTAVGDSASAEASRRFTVRAKKIAGVEVTTTEAAAEQTGQICELAGPGLMSAQKWNWAPRKRTARRRAKITTLLRWRSMQVLRPSLGEKGYRVKKYGGIEARELRLRRKGIFRRCAPQNDGRCKWRGRPSHCFARRVRTVASSGRSAPGPEISTSLASYSWADLASPESLAARAAP